MAIIIYGTNEHLGKSFEVDDFCCPYCDHYHSTELFISSYYFHVFFVPYIPTDKTGSTLCSHCKKVVPQVNFSPQMVELFREKRKAYRHPLKMYTGFLILPGSIVLAGLVSLVYHLLNGS